MTTGIMTTPTVCMATNAMRTAESASARPALQLLLLRERLLLVGLAQRVDRHEAGVPAVRFSQPGTHQPV